jgi:hypothetical protein
MRSLEAEAGRRHRLRDLRFMAPWLADHADAASSARLRARAGGLERMRQAYLEH